MAWQSIMSEPHRVVVSVARDVSVSEAAFPRVHEAETSNPELPACHQMQDESSLTAATTSTAMPVTMDCERDCHCCGGSCSVFAMTFDLPLALPAKQSADLFSSAVLPAAARSEAAIRPPIFS